MIRPRHARRMGRARAFTLLEVMIAIALILALSGSMFGFMFNLMDRRERLLHLALDGRASSMLVERLEDDLMGAVAGGGRIGSGIQGDATSLTIRTRSVGLPRGADRVGAMGDLITADYSYDERLGRLTMARSRGNVAGDESEVVSQRVRRFNLRYYDGTNWRERFDSGSAGALPVAVEIAIWFGEPVLSAEAEVELEEAERAISSASENPLDFENYEPEQFGDDLDFGFNEDEPIDWGEPDRLRVIIVPDGPVATWKEGA